jgi:hypothetical protein
MKKMTKALFAFSFVLVLSGVALAADQAVPGGFDSWKGLVKGVTTGALVGLALSYLGFLKDTDPNKKWDPKQAGVTLIMGAITGALAGFEKKDLTKPEDWYQAGTAVLLAELLGKVGFRIGAPVIGGAIQKLIGNSAAPAAPSDPAAPAAPAAVAPAAPAAPAAPVTPPAPPAAPGA